MSTRAEAHIERIIQKVKSLSTGKMAICNVIVSDMSLYN